MSLSVILLSVGPSQDHPRRRHILPTPSTSQRQTYPFIKKPETETETMTGADQQFKVWGCNRTTCSRHEL